MGNVYVIKILEVTTITIVFCNKHLKNKVKGRQMGFEFNTTTKLVLLTCIDKNMCNNSDSTNRRCQPWKPQK